MSNYNSKKGERRKRILFKMRRIFLNLFLLTVTFQLSLQDMLDKIMRSDVWNCKSRRSCFLCHKKYVGQPIFLSLIFFFPVKTCGVPSIDTSEMGNRSVRLGDKVTFNCKVNKNIFGSDRSSRSHNLCLFVYPSVQ